MIEKRVILLLQKRGFRRRQAETTLDEIYKSVSRIIRWSPPFNMLVMIYVWMIALRITSLRCEDKDLLGLCRGSKISIRLHRSESEMRERIAHEIWHVFCDQDIYADTFAELRLLEEDLISTDKDIRRLYRNSSLGLNDFIRVLEEKAHKDYPYSAGDDNRSEPEWFYGFGEDLGQLIFLIVGGNPDHAYRVLSLLTKGKDLATAVEESMKPL